MFCNPSWHHMIVSNNPQHVAKAETFLSYKTVSDVFKVSEEQLFQKSH